MPKGKKGSYNKSNAPIRGRTDYGESKKRTKHKAGSASHGATRTRTDYSPKKQSSDKKKSTPKVKVGTPSKSHDSFVKEQILNVKKKHGQKKGK